MGLPLRIPAGRLALRLHVAFEAGLGFVMRCIRCREHWPVDAEFFGEHGGLPASICHACRKERDRRYYLRRKAAGTHHATR